MASLLGRQVASSADILLFELKAMLRREEELRAFRRYRKAGRGPEGTSVVPLAVQLRVAEEFGVPPDICLEALRCAPALLFPDDAEVPTLSFYRRFNRCRDRSLAVGDSAPNVKLHPSVPPRAPPAAAWGGVSPSLSLHSLLLAGAKRGLVLVAGSYT